MAEYATLPEPLLHSISKNAADRSEGERAALSEYYRANIEPALKPERDRLAALKKEMTDMPRELWPIMPELTGDKRRKTQIQFPRNYFALARPTTAALP